MKSGWNMTSCNLMPFMHSTVLHTWFHKNSRQCALNLVCCSKLYQQSAPQDKIIHWSNDAIVNVISTLHSYILYTFFFYQCLSDQFSKHVTMRILNKFPFFTFYCINCISKESSDYTSQNKLHNRKRGCISDDTHKQCPMPRNPHEPLHTGIHNQNTNQTWFTLSTWETSEQSGHSSTSNFSHH